VRTVRRSRGYSAQSREKKPPRGREKDTPCVRPLPHPLIKSASKKVFCVGPAVVLPTKRDSPVEYDYVREPIPQFSFKNAAEEKKERPLNEMDGDSRSVLEVASLPQRLMRKARDGLEHPAASRALRITAAVGVAALTYAAFHGGVRKSSEHAAMPVAVNAPARVNPGGDVKSTEPSSATVPVVGVSTAPADCDLAEYLPLVMRESVLDGTLDRAVVVDPAGLEYIQRGSVAGAGAASEAVYRWLGITKFPTGVVRDVKRETDAAFHDYGPNKKVIHVASPNLKKVANLEDALLALTRAYKSVLDAFEGNGAGRTLRLLPISGGLFVGKFKSNIHELTARAFYEAGGHRLSHRIVLCTFISDPAPFARELAKTAKVVAATNPTPAAGQTFREAIDVLTKAYAKQTMRFGAPIELSDPSELSELSELYRAFLPELTARAVYEAGVENLARFDPRYDRYETAMKAAARVVTYDRHTPAPTVGLSYPSASATDEDGDAVTVAARYAKNGKVGVMVAGNSGRPAGNVGCEAGVACGQVHHGHTTQEESVVSSWMLGECQNCGEMSALFRSTIAARWGMRHTKGTDTATIQGVDYTTAEPEDYADAWVVRDATLKTLKEEDTVSATLVFVSGPNAGSRGTDQGSMTRTLNATMTANYSRFREGVKCAVRAGLDAMIREEVATALVARISCGIYAQKHKTQIISEFVTLVDEILDEDLGGRVRGTYFQRVIIPKVGKSGSMRYI